MLTTAVVAFVTLVELTVISAPLKLATEVPATKFVLEPVMVTSKLAPCAPLLGSTELIVGAVDSGKNLPV